jgi:UDP-3-O-[3-hydroxymyristoyl] N-acetylglucosamine deacetylase
MDNLYVDITAEEVPILDGSAPRSCSCCKARASNCRTRPSASSASSQPVEVREGQGDNLKWARLEPYHGYKLRFEIDFDHPAVDSTGQRVEFDLGTGSYSRDIARARTFGFTKDVEMMRANGLALGGGLDNAIVMDDYKVLNSDGLRYDDEFVKHKILDAMGDLYLVGKPLLAAYSAFRSGHALNNLLLRELLAHPEAWEIVTFEDEKLAPGRLCPARAGLVASGIPVRITPDHAAVPLGHLRAADRSRRFVRVLRRHGAGPVPAIRSGHPQMDAVPLAGLGFFGVLILERIA